MSGCPSRAESAHDIVENQHASVSLSWAAGGIRDRATAGHVPSCSTSWPARENLALLSDPWVIGLRVDGRVGGGGGRRG
ncbi:1-deoxy-D-xylulose-5-phosphate synthase N-terminal domain-containing protein [Streptomyces sp. NPDC057580]|uniref:1-deoxy-D-xylulose-5-phosphate synthase N-terminal domain-containing protein n=1 Tax=Streptomyces sp. NPDC057580 TaxID=3346173 RepID=UPI0036B139A5